MFYSDLQDGKAVAQSVETPVFDFECDVLVAGLGTAGALAAISAAEEGTSVIGIERLKMCGGTATAGGVYGYYYGLPGGRFEQIDQDCVELGRRDFVAGNNNRHPYAKSHVIEQALRVAGGRILYESTVVGVYREGETICGVRTLAAGRSTNIACRVLIDGSGDGEVSAAAGAGFEMGRDLDGQPQPFSSIRVFVRDGNLGLANFDAGYVRPTSAEDLTRGLLRANALHRGGLEDFGDGLLWLTLPPGPREGRLLDCDTRLRFDDFMKGGRCSDPLVYAYSNFDSHTQDWAFESEVMKDWMVAASLWGYSFTIPLPAEIMFVKGFSNLLSPGRSLSVDHDMACAVRMQRCLQKMGEGAGLIAARAARDKTGIRQVDLSEVRDVLRRSGALNSPDQLPEDRFETAPGVLRELLASEKPGVAIWVTGHDLGTYQQLLLDGLASDDQHLSRNCALALGLAGDRTAIPKLLEIVRERDSFEPSSSRSHNQRRLLGAIHLLGSLDDEQALTPLLELMQKPDLDLQEVSHALMALLKLGDATPVRRSRIADALNAALGEDCPAYQLVLKNSSSTGHRVKVDMTAFMRKVLAERLAQWEGA
jgi:hypothetical protein